MRPIPTPCAFAVGSVLCCLSPAAALAESYSELPPPPTLENNASGQQLLLELVVNQQAHGQIVPVNLRNGDYWVRSADLQQAGIPTEKLNGQQIDVNQLPGSQVEYDNQRQRLLLSVPASWLPNQNLGGATNGPRYPGRSSSGLLFNYDLYATRTGSAGSRLSGWNELRYFGNQGQIATTGVWQQQLEGEAIGQNKGYIRYDTWWSNEDENNVVSWRLGDLTTDALGWSNSVRLGGIQFGRDFGLRPDLITYPLPAFSGQAAVPSTVDLFINGYRSSQNQVQAGPWSITNVPFVNGAGEAVVTTTDALGRQVTTTLPFYVASTLLKSGLSDYSIAAGALRRNYGFESFDYGAAAASGSYRYGLTDWLTVEGHAEGSDSLATGGVGSVVRLGSLGVINGSVAKSQMSGQPGTQYSWGYQYNNSWFNLGMQQTLRSSQYGDLALASSQGYDSTNNSYTLARRSSQYNASVSLADYGSLGAAYIDISSSDGERTRLWNLSWSKNLWGNSSLYVSASRDQSSGEWSGAISLMIPFGERSSASFSVERDQQGGSAQRVSVSRAMPTDGGFSADASWANQSSDSGQYRQASLRWRNNKIDTSAGFYGDDTYSTQWADVTGSLVMMDGGIFAANSINDAFVLVKTDYPDVTVRYENQSMGRTDKQGYLLVPSISSYYAAKYDIDTLDLPADMTAPRVEQRFAVKRQSGYLLNFPVERLRSASVILHDQTGKPLPLSSQVLRANHGTEYIGWDGIVWMEDLAAHNPMQVVTPDGRSCEATLEIENGQPKALQTYGPLTCSLPPLPVGAAVPSSADAETGISP